MTISVTLPTATLHRLKARSAATGKDIGTLVVEAVEKQMAPTTAKAPITPARSFRKIMAPVHKDFRKSGMTENRLNTLIDREVAAARSERKAFTRRR